MCRSSLRRTMSNTHLINGFYDSSSNSRTNNYYAHGPYYQQPESSPYRCDGPRVYKSDRHSFFNGKIFTVRDIPKYRHLQCQICVKLRYISDQYGQDHPAQQRPGLCLNLRSLWSQMWTTDTSTTGETVQTSQACDENPCK